MNGNRIKKEKSDIDIRAVVVFCVILFGIAFSCLQILLINLKQSNVVSGVNTSKTLDIGGSRGIIYDTDMRRLVCNDYSYICAVTPAVNSLAEIRNFVDDAEYNKAVIAAKNQSPILLNSKRYVQLDNVVCEKVYKRYNDDLLAVHMIGYTDSSGNNGLTGVEYAFDRYLEEQSGYCKARFFINGKGSVMLGGKVEKEEKNFNSSAGVVLTIDKKYQDALEKAMDESLIVKGAAVLIDIKTGEIKASVSRPNFNPNFVEEYLKDSDSALFNRALGAYPVGSVFKPLVAASALEQGIDPDKELYCDGNIEVNSICFGCSKSHGKVNMATAIAYSCNCYFVKLIEKIDCSKVLELANLLGFGKAVVFDENLKTYSGYLPKPSELDSSAARANFSFGQGKLTANPFQIASLYSVIANNGEYVKPYLLKGFCNSKGEFISSSVSNYSLKLFSSRTARLLQSYLKLAVSNGTGQPAFVSDMQVAGKTSTAQSGEFINGKERLVTWFAGFFPFYNPQYVAVILCENGVSGAVDCAPVFSSFVKKVMPDIY